MRDLNQTRRYQGLSGEALDKALSADIAALQKRQRIERKAAMAADLMREETVGQSWVEGHYRRKIERVWADANGDYLHRYIEG